MANTISKDAQKTVSVACLSLSKRREGLRRSQYVSENGLGVIRYLTDAKRLSCGLTQGVRCIDPVSLGAFSRFEPDDNSSSRIILCGIHPISFS